MPLSTVPGPRSRSAHEPAQGTEGAFCDRIHRTRRVDAKQDALVGVEGDQRRRLLLVHLQPVPDGLLAVVIALEQLAAAVVADARLHRRVEGEVPDPAAAAA